MALRASFPPEKVFGFGHAFRDPLLGSDDAHGYRQRLLRQAAVWARLTQFGGMANDVRLKFPDQKCVYHVGRIMRRAFSESLVKLKGVASRASVRVRDWRHVGAFGNDKRQVGLLHRWHYGRLRWS